MYRIQVIRDLIRQGTVLTDEQKCDLLHSVESNEVKKTMFQMDNNKVLDQICLVVVSANQLGLL